MTTSPLLSTTPIPTPSKSYLELCQDELDPKVQASYHRDSTLNRVAATATIVAFTALMIGGFIAIIVHAPVFVPLAGICSLLLLGLIKKVYSMFNQKADIASKRAEQLGIINKHYQELTNFTPQQIQQFLHDKAIYNVTGMQFNDPQLTTLKPLMARHLFWEGQAQEWSKKQAKQIEKADKLSNEDLIENRDEIYELRSDALQIEQIALESKIKNAFINAVMRRPQFAQKLEDLGTFSPLTGQERAIAIQLGSNNSDAFFSFKNTSMPAIRYHEAKQLSVSELAMRLVQVMGT